MRWGLERARQIGALDVDRFWFCSSDERSGGPSEPPLTPPTAGTAGYRLPSYAATTSPSVSSVEPVATSANLDDSDAPLGSVGRAPRLHPLVKKTCQLTGVVERPLRLRKPLHQAA